MKENKGKGYKAPQTTRPFVPVDCGVWLSCFPSFVSLLLSPDVSHATGHLGCAQLKRQCPKTEKLHGLTKSCKRILSLEIT